MFGLTAEFAEENPNTTLALTKALIRAAMWLDADDGANRAEAVEILSRSEYVGADAEVIANSMTGTFEFEKGDKRPAPDFNVFFRDYASYPYYSDAVWTLTQMRRWGQIAEAKPDAWYDETAKSVYRPEIYEQAARLLVDEGKADGRATSRSDTDGYKRADRRLHRRHRVRRPQAERLPREAPDRAEGRPDRHRRRRARAEGGTR